MSNFITNLYERLTSKNRALAINDISNKIYEIFKEEDDYYNYWLSGFYADETGHYAVVSHMGELEKWRYRVNSNAELEIYEKETVQIEFTPVSRSNIIIKRTSDNKKAIWYGVIASSVLNRNAEIDTAKLFENFENEYEADSAYLCFSHLPKQNFAFGTVRSVYRYNELLLGSGEIDLTTKLGRSAEKALKSGKYGFSIGYLTNNGEEIEVGDIKVRTYEVGKLIEVSIVKETKAANYFTKANYKERFSMASKEKILKELIEFMDDEEAANELIEQADSISREIKNKNLITREKEEDVSENPEGDGEVEEVDGEAETGDATLVFGEDTLSAIARAVKAEFSNELTELKNKVDELSNKLKTSQNKQRDIDEDEIEVSKPYNRRTRTIEFRPTEKMNSNNEDVAKISKNVNDLMRDRLEGTKVN